jgi:carboxyl-terminal processing protease
MSKRFLAGPNKILMKACNIFVLTVTLSILALSCKEDDVLVQPKEEEVNENNQYVNNWILGNMQEWYLWNDDLPEDVDINLSPEEYFSSLLNSEDRFSWIQPNYQELLNSLQGINKEAGFEFVLYKEDESDKVVAQILYVKPQSPAQAAGLKRGDLISKINGQIITAENYRNLIKDLKKDHSLEYKPLLIDEHKFGEPLAAELKAVEYTENPNYLSKVIEEGNHKVGYYVYNFFASGTENDDEKYDLEMDEIFSVFKNEGVTDMVLDLRFNSGGSEVSAKNLASLVGPGVNRRKLFFSRTYNSNVMDEITNDPELGPEFLKSFFYDEPSNIGSQLSGRVYILTSSRTASASELIINGLRPYMQVFLIGDVTYGKNVGSISIYEENDRKNGWGLQPIVVKVTNSAGFSDYSQGFNPDIENKDNGLYIYPLGDPRENLLSEALAHIQGVTLPGRVGASAVSRKVIGHSLDEKIRGFNLFMENPTVQ